MNIRLFLHLWILLGFFGSFSYSQVNFLGKPGLMTIPSAKWEADKPLGLSFSYFPREYSNNILLTQDSSPGGNDLNFYSARASLTAFMEVGMSISYRPSLAEQIGIGDRHLDLRFKLMEEKEFFPALVLGWTPPGSVSPALAHDYLVATKNFNTTLGLFQVTAGFGSPYVFLKNDANEGIRDFFKIERKTEVYGSRYLDGFFGGFSYMPLNYGGLMLEYNTKTFNAGAFVKLWEWLHLQAYTLEAKEVAFQVAVQFSLNSAPRALRNYEKNMD
ncbi:YjbH domain-containing protein [Zunongwangia sp. F260]|uniref:YjbH domain-containing protein n=1 Tax=Autumnicola lenta TaxID=3075593 RepID=A0ABU3CNE8_9FLAO|nr:YjbH domain-containing protein [Zunongwangia sp. F260]MDT0647455.1 YjbH domain-containing protein [Zunongwangia sp. F260]